MKSTRSIVGAALAAAALLVLGACGSSSGSDSAATGASTTTTAAATTTSTAAAVAKAQTTSAQGSVLADANGKTLYTLTAGGKALPCTGKCLDAWPPAMVPSGTAGLTVDGTKVSVMAGSGGDVLAVAGMPLYTFAGDQAAGDANGEGISGFGGTWHVVHLGAAGEGGAAATSTPAASTTTSGSMTTTTAAASSPGGY